MRTDDLFLERWDRLSAAERTGLARQLALDLPTPFQFREVMLFQMAKQQHQVALFDYQGSQFALIPGGPAVLGHDPEGGFVPTREQLHSWKGTAAEYGLRKTLAEYIQAITTPLRTRVIAPFLLEVRATEVGVGPPVKIGKSTAYSITPQTQQQVVSTVKAQGFRLATSDEWEYACGAGSRTLFRWGDFCPVDCYPTDKGKKITFDLHRRANAFGLHIAENPYHWEFVADTDLLRGGDGGGAICGGSGFFSGWLTLASAFIEPGAASHYRDKPVYGAHQRRLFPLT